VVDFPHPVGEKEEDNREWTRINANGESHQSNRADPPSLKLPPSPFSYGGRIGGQGADCGMGKEAES
jgi:hypothetical protein